MDKIASVIKKELKHAVFPMVCADHCAWLAGIDLETAVTDSETLANITIDAQRQYGYDAILLFSDAYIEAQAMGCPVKLSPIPIITGPMGGEKIDRTSIIIEAASKIKEKSEVPVYVSIKGPFSLASFLYGLKEFMIALLKDPDKTRSFLNLAFDFQMAYLDKLTKLGVNVMIGDPVASASVISPDTFSNFALPPLKKMIAKTHAAGSLAALHICGDTGPIIDYLDQSGADLLSIEDISIPTTTTRMGGIATNTILYGSVTNIKKEAKAALGNDFLILSTSCDVPIQSPPENIEAMIDFVRAETSNK